MEKQRSVNPKVPENISAPSAHSPEEIATRIKLYFEGIAPIADEEVDKLVKWIEIIFSTRVQSKDGFALDNPFFEITGGYSEEEIYRHKYPFIIQVPLEAMKCYITFLSEFNATVMYYILNN